MPQTGQEATSIHKPVTKCPENISEVGCKCVCLNASSIAYKTHELNIMVDDIDPHIIGITESLANKDAELGLSGYLMFRRDRTGRKGGESFYILKNIFRFKK